MNLPLVIIDFKEHRARRYWPKPTGGFMTDDATLCAVEDQLPSLRDEIEAFRRGPEKKQSIPERFA